jgi:hypothetical protein
VEFALNKFLRALAMKSHNFPTHHLYQLYSFSAENELL